MNTALTLAFWIAVFRVLDPAHPREILRIRDFSFHAFFKAQLHILGAALVFLGSACIMANGIPGLRAMESFLWILLPATWPLVVRRDLSLSEWIIASGIAVIFLPAVPALGGWGAGGGVVLIVFLSALLELGLRAILDRLVYSPRGKSRAVWGIALFSLALLMLALECGARQFYELYWLDADPLLLHLFVS